MKNYGKLRKMKQRNRVLLTQFLIALLYVQLFFTLNVYAQQTVTVNGTVTDTQGQPLPGTTVVEGGTTNGTVTNADGIYTITVPFDATLSFSFVGMKTQNVTVSSRTLINISLEEELLGLEEVVVVGYGEQRRRNITSAISSIDGKVFENRTITRMEEALQGMVPGLNITKQSGQPGAQNIDFKIRGISTFSNNPVLTIIDGVPSSLSVINPIDIENISVLKDAASTAIYGSRASGGVILVTTKQGKKGTPKVNINSIFSMQKPTKWGSKVSAYDHMVSQNKMRENDGGPPKYSDEEIQASLSPEFKEWDWEDFMFKNALQLNQNISFSGGTESQDYYASFGYLNQDGIFLNSSYERFNIQLNQNIKISKKLKLNYKVSYAPETTIAPSAVSFGHIMETSKLVGIKSEDGKWLTHPERTGDGRNPLYRASEDGGQQLIKRNRFLGNIFLNYEIFKNFNLNTTYGINQNQFRNRNYTKLMTFWNQFNTDEIASTTDWNILNINNSADIQQNLNFLVSYQKNLDAHDLSILAGYTTEWFNNHNDQVSTRDFLTDEIYVINAGTKDKSLWDISGTASDWALASILSRISYSYKNKYLLEGALRYDGSSRFKKDIRWGLFPSISAGWIITDENFLQNNRIFSFLKLRTSWGKVGNQNVGLYPFANVLAQSSTIFGNSVYRTVETAGAPNPLLTWESKESYNFGIEGKLFSHLIEYNVELFKEKTKDILLQLPVPTTFGQTAPVQNAGIVENRGWEIELQHRNNVGKLIYGIYFQVSDATNKVIDLKGLTTIISGNKIIEEGHPMNEWYGLRAIGIFQSEDEVKNHPFQNPITSTGDLKYEENGGDSNTINSDDRIRLGRSDSRFPYGIRVNLNYKNFDFLAFGQGVLYNLVYSTGPVRQNFYSEGTTINTYHLDSWSIDNPNARFPKFRNGQATLINSQFSSFWLENGSYFRLKHIELGYKIKKSLLEKIKVEDARIFLSAENLFVITNYLGYDPEMPNAAQYPLPKLLSLGLNINF